MKLIIYNGSPRRKKSNSRILAEQFLKGFHEIKDEVVPMYYLGAMHKEEEHLRYFIKAEIILFFFPLYTDCMPGIVKHFFETIYKSNIGGQKKIGYVVQSGFPEGHHSIYLERYLKRFTTRLGYKYLGTVIRGGVEGIQVKPSSWTKKLFNSFQDLGREFGHNEVFDQNIMDRLLKPYKLSTGSRLLIRILNLTGLTNYYWNSKLKEHGAYQNRFAQPYK